MRGIWSFALLFGLSVTSAAGQATGGLRECEPIDIPLVERNTLLDESSRVCYAVVQALSSTPAQIGILAASGNPVLASHSAGGLRLGRFAPVDATVRLQAARLRLPNLLAEDPAAVGERLTVVAPALSADIAVGVFDGVQLSPQARGAGAVDLLGSAGALPLALNGGSGFERGAATLGLGARVGLVREGFATPGVALTLMHHWLGRVTFGNVCPGGEGPSQVWPVCPGPGSLADFTFDLRSWSGRAVVGRRFLGVGVSGGAGYDRFRGRGEYAFRVAPALPEGAAFLQRGGDPELRDGRWSAFANASFTHLLVTFGAEVGWMQGDAPVRGFEQFPGDFDPRRGTIFGGVGGRLAF